MKNLAMIACVSQDGGLGMKGDLLWHIPEDMRFFKETTMGSVVVMGRKTFASIGRALPGRQNIILSRSGVEAENAQCFQAEDKLITWLREHDGKKFIIGGASLYEKFLPESEVIYLTEVATTKPADVFFPKFDRGQFDSEELDCGQYQDTDYRIVKYTKKQEGRK